MKYQQQEFKLKSENQTLNGRLHNTKDEIEKLNKLKANYEKTIFKIEQSLKSV